MEEIAELRNALDRLHAAMDDLVVRGVRSAGAQEVARLSALRDEFRTAGAEHLAEKLSTLVDAIQGDRGAATALMRAVTTFRLFDRMLTLEVAQAMLAAPEGEEAREGEEEEGEEE